MRRPLCLALLLSLACDPFGHWPDGSHYDLDASLWDPAVQPRSDGVYVRLPHAGLLVRLSQEDDLGRTEVVDLEGAWPRSIQGAPDDDRLLVFRSWWVCNDPDTSIRTPDDCPEDELQDESELVVVKAGEVAATLDAPPHLSNLRFSPSGNVAVAWLSDEDLTEDIFDNPLIDLNQVAFVPLDGGPSTSISVGFRPTQVLFTEDQTRAVIMSRSEVQVVELEGFTTLVTYPLTLDADIAVDPSDAVLTPDGRYALVSVSGSSDLFKLDLNAHAIDVEDLDAVPSDLQAVTERDETLIVYGAQAQVDILDHDDDGASETLPLDDAMSTILLGDGFAILANTSSSTHDVIHLNLDTRELTEFVLDNPVESIELAPGGRYAVAITRPESTGADGIQGAQDSRYGMAVLDLDELSATNLVATSRPVGLELLQEDESTWALVLMEDVDTLLQVDLSRPDQPKQLDLNAPPLGIGAMPDGRFTITHDVALGLVSLVDPKTGETSQVAGFAAAGVLDQPGLLLDEETEK